MHIIAQFMMIVCVLCTTFTRASLTTQIVLIMVTEGAACVTCHVSWPLILVSPKHWIWLSAGHIKVQMIF